MSTCLKCTGPLPPPPPRKTRPRYFCKGSCAKKWRLANPGRMPSDVRAGRKLDTLWHRLPDPRDLGPERPLLGLSPEEARNVRLQRMAQAARDGVESDALAERFGLSPEIVRWTLKRIGVRLTRTNAAFGLPS